MMIMLTALSVPLVTGAAIAFWMLAPVMILGALGMILARKPVHSALCLAAVMISLAVQYAAQEAPFLFVVQIIVYTGAILMLFLFVLMLVGVDIRFWCLAGSCDRQCDCRSHDRTTRRQCGEWR